MQLTYNCVKKIHIDRYYCNLLLFVNLKCNKLYQKSIFDEIDSVFNKINVDIKENWFIDNYLFVLTKFN